MIHLSMLTDMPIEHASDTPIKRKESPARYSLSKNIPSSEVIKPVSYIMQTTCFAFNGDFYRQKTGLPMGLPWAPRGAEIVMQDVECCFLRFEDTGIHVPFYKWYVDYILTEALKDEDLIQEFFNSEGAMKLKNDGKKDFSNDDWLVNGDSSIFTNWYLRYWDVISLHHLIALFAVRCFKFI